MSAPNQPATTTPPPSADRVPIPGPQDWSAEDRAALSASVFWFDLTAPPELKERYKGMHVAILGERIVDADCDKRALWRRLEVDAAAFPPNRVLIRYVPTDEEAWTRLWLR